MLVLKRTLLAAAFTAPITILAANSTILGWNNLGMHCMDSDYSVFSILPPYNTIEAQLVVAGKLVTNGTGYTVTYEAIADPSGSYNSTAMGKGNFYTFATALYGAALAPEAGLAGWPMPGTNNIPRAMLFEQTNRPAPGVATEANWYRAEGIPIAPYDDTHRKNPYPLMRLIARNAANQPIATNDVVLPVSDEMDCRACHASGTQETAKPSAGWVWDGVPERDFRLNILRLHDENEFSAHPVLYAEALAARGFNPQGLYRGVLADGKPVLCAACHASEALGAPSYGSIPALTASVHSYHAGVTDPVLNITLDNAANRATCYRCHPGSETKCLRGAMGGAVAADGSLEMQCQSCHGNMSQVGAIDRVGWFMEPNCQSCHVGTANHTTTIRYTSVFTDAHGTVRSPVDQTFATTPDTPAPGISLYRFSKGHGGLQCSACHGSTHAEFPSTHNNDNLRNLSLQGHSGVMAECTACHTTMPNTITNGPHGLHPISNNWAMNHGDLFEGTPPAATRQQCQACHGTDYKGTVLSRALGPRTLSTKFGTRTLWRGKQVGCFDCHNGVNSSNPTVNTAPAVANVATNTVSGAAVAIVLPATDPNPNPLNFRIVSQPAHGTVGVSSNLATYFADQGFVGSDTFTFAANDTWSDSNLATGTVAVAQGPYSIEVGAHAPPTYPAAWPVAFTVIPMVKNLVAPVSFDWNFGDGTAHDTNQFPAHAYAAPGVYSWSVQARAGGAEAVTNGTITIGIPVSLGIACSGDAVTVSWPNTIADTLLERSRTLGPTADWHWVTNTPVGSPALLQVTLPGSDSEFFRVRRPW
jgi:PKD repeat protein